MVTAKHQHPYVNAFPAKQEPDFVNKKLFLLSHPKFNLYALRQLRNHNTQIKKKVIKFLQADLRTERNKSLAPLNYGGNQSSLAAPKTGSIGSTDNKRFLFLYFILPIFFTTLKNIGGFADSTTTTNRAKKKLKNLNNQKKQLRSLIKLMLNSGSGVQRSIGKAVAARAEKANVTKRSSSSPLLQFLPTLTPTSNMQAQHSGHTSARTQDINNLMETLNLNILKTKKKPKTRLCSAASTAERLQSSTMLTQTQQNGNGSVAERSGRTQFTQHSQPAHLHVEEIATIGQKAQPLRLPTKIRARMSLPTKRSILTKKHKLLTQTAATKGEVALRSYANALELLKWSVLFIGQSLAPLKRKQEYYSLIFIKILEARGFLALNNKNNIILRASLRTQEGGQRSINKQNLQSVLAERSATSQKKNNKNYKYHTDQVRTKTNKTLQTLGKVKTDIKYASIAQRNLKETKPEIIEIIDSLAGTRSVAEPTVLTRPLSRRKTNPTVQPSGQQVLDNLQVEGYPSWKRSAETIKKSLSKKVKGKDKVKAKGKATTKTVLLYGTQALYRLRAQKQLASTDLEAEHTNTNKLGLITFYPGGRNISD